MKKIRLFFEMIKFEHTLFALPFAYLGYAFAARSQWRFSEIFWVTIAMLGARTGGMCMNRIIDRRLDELNPRTRLRALVTGEFSPVSAWIINFLSFAALFFAAYRLNPLCFKLAPVALFFLVIYHYLKRWTWLCHFGIGLVLAMAPLGGWMAHTGAIEPAQVVLSFAVLFWVAGFDIFYSLQDVAFDRSHGVHSLPARFGEKRSLEMAGVCHLLTIGCLIAVGIMIEIAWPYWTGLIACAVILLMEHRLIRRNAKKHLEFVFFAMNGTLSGFFFIVAMYSLLV